MENERIIIIGAGLAGLSATLECARAGVKSVLVSLYPSERAQSVMAEGGINAALDTKGEGDSPLEHFEDTMRAGRFLADEEAVRGMTTAAPGIVKELFELGVCFNTDPNGVPDLRSFGGQKKKRTAFAGSESGKQIMTALTDAVRRFEAEGIVKRFYHHEFVTLAFDDKDRRCCRGALIRDTYTGELLRLAGGAVIMATGGLHGFFNDTTGSVANTGAAAAEVYRLGVTFANLEFIQYHPTTVESSGKRMLISEAARGEGGRLFADMNGERYYFMEDKYPELGNLMPRDITAREIYYMRRKYPVYLDMTHLPDEVMSNKLGGLVEDCMIFLNKDIRREPIEVAPGIHYFMGGISTDASHKTNFDGLYAAGECCCLYHGANRLGGNSLLGAVYGGKTAARGAVKELERISGVPDADSLTFEIPEPENEGEIQIIKNALTECMGVVRSREGLERGLEALAGLHTQRAHLARAIVRSALERKESRGAHYREDYTEERDEYRRVHIS